MDRIEELLERLLDTQACATFYREVQGSFDDTRSTEARVEAIVGIIAADFRAMVAALEASEKTLDAIGGLATVKDSGVITLLPYYARKLAKMLNETLPTVQAVLARVKGE